MSRIFFYVKRVLPIALGVLFILQVQGQQLNKIDTLKTTLSKTTNVDDQVKLYFEIAETFMDADLYDSSQIWLNKISAVIPFQQPSLNSYFLSCRQAEVYYYNGLSRLGLQESNRSLNIASALNDSLLLADAYNFIGLFYINLDSSAVALSYLKKGISYVKQPPYPSQYLNLTFPHHLYGNLSEAYTNLGLYDSAIINANISLKLAQKINWSRGIAVAKNNIANNYLQLKKADTALYYFQEAIISAKASGDFDVELLNYGGLAKTYQLLNNKVAATQTLEAGFAIINIHPIVNNLFTIQFLDDALSVFKYFDIKEKYTAVLFQKNNLLQKIIKSNNQQMGIILNASLQNETRLLNLQLQQITEQNNTATSRLYYLLLLLIAGIVAFLFYRYGALQKLQKSMLQNNISKDLHDDVGASLSSLNVYSTVAAKVLETNPSKAKEMLQKISEQSTQLMENISDIVWSMKSEKDETINLKTKIKIFISDVLSAAEINYELRINEADDVAVNNFTARRNILLIIKEAVNNAVKYSKATNIIITIKKLDNTLYVAIEDNGVGFNMNEHNTNGNGIKNMQKRAAEIKGNVTITAVENKGTHITLIFPLATLNNTGW